MKILILEQKFIVIIHFFSEHPRNSVEHPLIFNPGYGPAYRTHKQQWQTNNKRWLTADRSQNGQTENIFQCMKARHQ